MSGTSAPRGPFWLPRGVTIGRWSGGALLPPRLATLLRPCSPSWSQWALPAPPASTPLPAAGSLPSTGVSKAAAVSLTDAQVAKRLRVEVDSRTRALDGLARFLVRFGEASDLFKKLRDEGKVPAADVIDVTAAFEARKATTLQKRLGSLTKLGD